MLFPEGTRSKDGKLLPFKAGSLKSAQRGNAMIVPMAIDGACNVLTRGKYIMHPKQVTVTVFPPIPVETVKEMDTVDLALLVRNQIAGALGQPLLKKEDTLQNEEA
jgi:1-acyl-sn-glycerol-3-phosphate acyltransferase